MEQLASIVARVFDLPPSKVNDDLSRDRLETWTSLNHLLLISEIEEEMNIQFTSNEVLEIKSFKDLRTIVSKKK